MEFMNVAIKENRAPREREKFLLLLAPYAPHICEELWQRLGHQDSISKATWPDYDPDLASVDQVTYSIQVNGKHRLALKASPHCTQAEVEELALQEEAIQKAVSNSKIVRKIFVTNKILNFVVKRAGDVFIGLTFVDAGLCLCLGYSGGGSLGCLQEGFRIASVNFSAVKNSLLAVSSSSYLWAKSAAERSLLRCCMIRSLCLSSISPAMPASSDLSSSGGSSVSQSASNCRSFARAK